jgi:hypothetical protein
MDRQIGKEICDLEGAAQSQRCPFMRRPFRDIFAEYKDPAAGRGDQPAYDVKKCCLACTVGSNHHPPFPRLYVEINMNQSLEPLEILGYLFYDERSQGHPLLMSFLIGP